MFRLSILISFLLFFALYAGAENSLPAPIPKLDPTATTQAEKELGKKIADEIEKDSKMVKDDATIEKLNAMAAAIVPFTERPGVVYSCKIIAAGDPNAMSIPGGTIYFTTGLLNAVESDDELAGVLAHEMAHNSLGHVHKMLESEARGKLAWLLATVASVFVHDSGGDTPPIAAISTMSSLVVQSLNNGYQEEMESEADLHAVDYIYKSKKYDPLGIYSVMMGFQQIEQNRANVDPGYLRTHPEANVRLVTIEKRLKELGISMNLWRVQGFRAVMAEPQGDEKGYSLMMRTVKVITLTATVDNQTPATRIAEAVIAINAILQRQYIQQYDITSTLIDGKAYITFDRKAVLILTADDVTVAGIPLGQLADNATKNIKFSIWQEIIKHS